jgi:hypothetical protein
MESKGSPGRARACHSQRARLRGASVAALFVASLAVGLGCDQAAAQDPRWKVWSSEVHRPSSLPGLPYELAPSIERDLGGWSVKTNSRGARDAEPTSGNDVFRVAVLGGSFAFGWGVPVEQTWPALLERELARTILVQGREVDFLDAAVSGLEVPEQVALLEGRVLELEPWVVVLEHSFEDRSAPQLTALRPSGPTIEALHDPAGVHWKAFSDALEEVRALAGPREIPRILVIVPRLRAEAWERYPYRALHKQVAQEARSKGFEPLDLLERFEAEPPQSLTLAPDDPQPNAHAHALAADAFKRFLYSSGALGQVLERH